ncbi:MAG: FHA domain-containing protein [Calothrix sp. FI2-JRJ7]|jgi:pSer/pThr/pTyr-binding forkhead associated (FHA) protein|nr:FHA domain-containing protein [Calothrix sp. FI2-JRJ7]
MLECVEAELERRLCLYQTFLKLYEHYGSLLDEILGLETLNPSSVGVKSFYLQGVIDNSSVYVTTNLCQGQTLCLRQPQSIWTLGRDKNSGIHLVDSYASRSHAAIYYEEQKFYLVDFNSTNGSYVNGERIFKSIELKDGDHIRLGNTTFDFFLNASTRILPAITLESRMLTAQESVEVTTTRNLYQHPGSVLEILEGAGYAGCINKAPLQKIQSNQSASQLLQFEQSQEIVDYFLSKNINK